MKRNFCSKCRYPVKTCVCKYVSSTVHSRTQIIVLQHPDEANLAKNTARLLQLQLGNIQLYVGQDFQQLKALTCNQHCALLYPNEHAVTVQQIQQLPKLDILFVIDGTWKKAHKILALNAWLLDLQAVTFNVIPVNQYRIRKAEQPHSLSTLESVSLFLNQYEGIDQRPLLSLLNGMITEQTKLMPTHVKARYDL
ncbi:MULTISPECIES: tRNA-uridine aminocarboxypropyltransferase [Pseudoalteromonas]|uniref:tRNA-uridine aminocarboxypropyltransferase n=1 Tax=Pseudoalteromonas amylolytica TaxID=1859457 RepID=A0A1S1MQK9_9GAMM|nr:MULTISPECIES: tRNA-uridine aminocarboxypropyltransferase [Pseudoalteromonas]MCF6436153.1 DTW domain-containing protein [Pseudoalteromonas sp. MMG022]OHU86920.1 DTW domain-containing protein [Pseudoalteromonas sp. JW3]OHU88370.1 DTW domain-containing protein [Pseudoalteromonas amylolytica]